MNSEIIAEVLASLSAQKEHLPTSLSVEEAYVDSFHEQLELLAKAGVDVRHFRVSSDHLKRVPVSFKPGKGTTYLDERYVDRSILLTKIDTVLNLCHILESKKQIGFIAE